MSLQSSPAPEQIQLFRSKVSYLRDQFETQSRLAELLEVNRSRISRWLKSEAPDPRNRAKVEALEFVLSRLHLFLEEETARKWLFGSNAHLGHRRPIDLIRDGRIAEVIGAIEQLETGAFA